MTNHRGNVKNLLRRVVPDKLTPRAYMLLNKFGLTEEQHALIFEAQNGCCAICGVDATTLRRSLCVDHCHQTGIVRGLLCDNCNVGISRFRDDCRLVQKALEYLQAKKL